MRKENSNTVVRRRVTSLDKKIPKLVEKEVFRHNEFELSFDASYKSAPTKKTIYVGKPRLNKSFFWLSVKKL